MLTVRVEKRRLEFHLRWHVRVFFWEGETGSEEASCCYYFISYLLALLFAPFILRARMVSTITQSRRQRTYRHKA